MAHDINGPSQLKKRELCPGSSRLEAEILAAAPGVLLDETMPETAEEQSIYAARGSLGHAWVAAVLRGKPGPEIPEDLIEPCAFCIDTAKMIQHVVANLGPVPEGDPIILVEHRVGLAGIGIPEDGTIDFALVWPGKLAIGLDWKFGSLWTDNPKWNRQCHGYAWGLRADFGCPEVWFGVCQPDLDPELRVRIDKFEGPALDRIETDIHRIIAWTKVANPPRRPGKHCGFCLGKDLCRERQEYGAQLSVITNPAGVLYAACPADRRTLWEKISIAVKTLETAKEQIVALMIADPSIQMDGYEIGPGKSSREWKDTETAHMALMMIATERGIAPELLRPSNLVSPAQAEKVIGKRKEVLAKLEPLILTSPGKPTIVPAKAKS